MNNKIVNIVFIIISIFSIVEPIIVLSFNYNNIGDNLIFLIFIEIVSVMILCFIFKKKDIFKLVLIFYLIITWFIPIYNIKVENHKDYNDIIRKNGKIMPSDIVLNKVNLKNIYGITIRQENEKPEICT